MFRNSSKLVTKISPVLDGITPANKNVIVIATKVPTLMGNSPFLQFCSNYFRWKYFGYLVCFNYTNSKIAILPKDPGWNTYPWHQKQSKI
jgi:hypothetical protein